MSETSEKEIKSLLKKDINQELRYAISICKGKGFNAPYHTKLTVLLHFKEWFIECGFPYQSKILDYWINRFRRDHNLQLSQELTTHKEGVILV